MQLIGYIPIPELELMTPKEWEQMIKGARHRRLDALEDMRVQAVMFARMNNSKDVKGITKKIEKERALINQTESSYEHDKQKDKEHQKKVREVQRRALQRWLNKKFEKGEGDINE